MKEGRGMETEPILELRHITKRYDDTLALCDVSAAFYSGRIYGIVGQNGSGKSTLLHHIAGLVRPDSGEIRLFGKPFAPREPADADKNGIFCILNTSNLIGTLSIAENTLRDMYPKSAIGLIKWKELYREAAALYASLHIRMDVFAPASSLSLRDGRLVELMRAYRASARLVVFDEPDFSPEDPNYAAILHMFEQIAQKGGCVLITTHRLNTMLQIVDEVMVLENGRLADTVQNDAISSKRLMEILSGKHMETPDIYPKLRSLHGPPMLRLADVSTQGGLRHLNMDLYRGEILGISALRTELRMAIPRAIYGLDHITDGALYLHGQKVSIKSPGDAMRFGIGHLQEDRVECGLQNEFPIAPNISLSNLKALRLLGLLRRDKEENVARRYVRRFNIKTGSMREKVSCLSTGNQQKVLLCRLLFSNSRILILEEPTRNIDKSSKIEIYNFMSNFVQKGGTILLASSHIDELTGMCDRILVLRNGGDYTVLERAEFDKEAILSHSL